MHRLDLTSVFRPSLPMGHDDTSATRAASTIVAIFAREEVVKTIIECVYSTTQRHNNRYDSFVCFSLVLSYVLLSGTVCGQLPAQKFKVRNQKSPVRFGRYSTRTTSLKPRSRRETSCFDSIVRSSVAKSTASPLVRRVPESDRRLRTDETHTGGLALRSKNG